MFPQYDSVLGCLCLASSKRLGAYPTQSKTVLVGDLGLRGWQSLGGFPIFRVVRVDDLDQVLLITLTHSRLPELFLLCCKLFLLLHRYGSPFYHHLSLPLLQLLKTLSCAMSRSILQLFWSATGSFGAFSTLDLVL
jgi:hypothetical protein